MTAPKQKRIFISQKSNTDGKTPDSYYNKINRKAQNRAMKELGLPGFMMWMYMVSNMDFHEFDLSPTYLKNEYGLSDRHYDAAVKDLIEKGYLVKTPHNFYKNYYEFHDIPMDTNCTHEIKEVKKEVIKEIRILPKKEDNEVEEFVF